MQITKKWRVLTISTDLQTRIRMPGEMLEHLKEQAMTNARSFNSEIIIRLARTLYEEDAVNVNNQGENHENI